MNLKLKHALINRQIPAYKSAIEAGINPNKVSKFVAELVNPTQQEKEALSRVLGCPAVDLFPEPTPPVVAQL